MYDKHDMTARSKFMEVLVGESNWRRDVLMGLASMLRRQPMITQVNLGLMFCRICCRGLNALRHVEAITLDDIDVDGWREYIWCFSLEIQTIRWGRRENPDRYLWRSSGRSASEGVVVLMSIHVQRGQEVVEHCMPSLRRRREDNSISAELWNRRVVLTRDSLLTLIREDEIKIPFLPSACIFLTHVKKMGMYPKLPFQSRTLCLISCKVPVRKEAIVLRNAFPVPSRDITIEANISHTTRRVYILHTRMYYPLLARHHLPNSKLLTSVGSHEHDLWWQNTLARILFILSPCWRSRWPKRKFRNFKVWELPSQNQEFLTHSVELPVHRTGN